MQQLKINSENLYILEQQISSLNEQVQYLTEQMNMIHVPNTKEWMNCKEACTYMGISYNTFIKYRGLGLKVCEIEGVKRVSKKDIDEFFIKNSY